MTKILLTETILTKFSSTLNNLTTERIKWVLTQLKLTLLGLLNVQIQASHQVRHQVRHQGQHQRKTSKKNIKYNIKRDIKGNYNNNIKFVDNRTI